MLTLADTNLLLDQTTSQLSGKSGSLTPQTGVALIDAWLPPLQQGENTRPLAEQLTALKALLLAQPVDEIAVQTALSPLAEQLALLATEMGGEGEMPSLLEGLARVLRQAASSSRADTPDSIA